MLTPSQVAVGVLVGPAGLALATIGIILVIMWAMERSPQERDWKEKKKDLDEWR